MKYALLTGGPSLAYTWHEGMFDLFDEIHAINMVGKLYRHHYIWYLDTAHRVFGEQGVKQWPLTISGYYDKKPTPLDPRCSLTFPTAFYHLVNKPDAQVYIFGWDCEGAGVVDGKEWRVDRPGQSADDYERNIMAAYWKPENVAGVSGKMQDWARENLGFSASSMHLQTDCN